MEFDFRLPFVNYTFTQKCKVKFGEALYLSGSLPELGQWIPSRALRMNCKYEHFWAVTVAIPIELNIEFKFFIAPYDLQSNICQTQNEVKWLGITNSTLRIPHALRDHFEKSEDRKLSVMSFNLRYQNIHDKGEKSWEYRKAKCCSLIIEHLPDLIGIQEGKNSQISFIQSQIGQLYRYFGRPRDLHEDEHSGIFVRMDKFLVLEDDYYWINETLSPGKKGFGARLPRYYTCLVLVPLSRPESWIMMVNTHLDHESELAREEGIKLIAATIKQKTEHFSPNLKDIFITGDFNTPESDPIFKQLILEGKKMESVRNIVPKKDSDFEETFHGFFPKLSSMVGLLTSRAAIDHIWVRLQEYRALRFMRVRQPVVSDHYPILSQFEIKKE